MAATSHSAAFKALKLAFISSLHWAARSAGCARLYGKNMSSTKSSGTTAASRGLPMGSCWRFLTVHLMNLLPLFFYFRSIHWKFVDSLRRTVREVISIRNSRPIAEHWSSTEVRKESTLFTWCPFRVERNDALSRALHTMRALRGPPTVVTLSLPRRVGLQMMPGFGRYPFVEVSQNGCSSAKRGSNLRYVGTDWCTCVRWQTSTYGGENSIHRLRPALPTGSSLPREWKVVPSSRRMEAESCSKPLGAELMKS